MVPDAWDVERAGSAKRVDPAFRAASSRLLPTGRRPGDAARAVAEASLRGGRPGYLGGRWAPPTPRRLPPRAPAPRGLPRRWSPYGGPAAAPALGGACTISSALNHDRLGDQERAVGGCASDGQIDASLKRNPPSLPRPLSPRSSAKARIRGMTLVVRNRNDAHFLDNLCLFSCVAHGLHYDRCGIAGTSEARKISQAESMLPGEQLHGSAVGVR